MRRTPMSSLHYLFPEVEFGWMSEKTTPPSTNIWMPIKNRMFLSEWIKSINYLFCETLKDSELNTFQLCSICLSRTAKNHQGALNQPIWLWPAAGKRPLCSHPGWETTATLLSRRTQPRAEPQQDPEEDCRCLCRFLYIFSSPYPSLAPMLVFISGRTTVVLFPSCQGWSGEEKWVCDTLDPGYLRSETMWVGN